MLQYVAAPIPPPVRSGASPRPLALLLIRNPAQRPDGTLLDRLLAEVEAHRPEQREPTAVPGAVALMAPRDAVPTRSAAPKD
ncbi:hypothetical protein RM550_36375 [Streptomyces sp. DSM 41527]|uniref:Uncharacterized protein n=1 Tax=Streptomyces mooreae TaxID=3075523 RepID=A0ABU2TJL8_9ACTN|nr:hypothetical protein [Streptomyces sp. DSM 41527]MDT0461120.1 hypothetical protein [Streptomyces sp. DSM 41527]